MYLQLLLLLRDARGGGGTCRGGGGGGTITSRLSAVVCSLAIGLSWSVQAQPTSQLVVHLRRLCGVPRVSFARLQVPVHCRPADAVSSSSVLDWRVVVWREVAIPFHRLLLAIRAAVAQPGPATAAVKNGERSA